VGTLRFAYPARIRVTLKRRRGKKTVETDKPARL
jgi:hypothetical protein